MPPSLAEQIAQRSEGLDKRAARGAFVKYMLMLARHGNAYQAREYAKAERCSQRVIDLLNKTAVLSGGLDSWSGISDYQNVQQAFLESLRSVSVFDAALANGMVRAPLHSRGFSITAGITGSVVPERSVKPISQLTMTQQLLDPKKAAAIIIISKELGSTPGAATLFGNELTKAVAAATDQFFLAALIAATTPTGSAGATLANITTDLETLLTAVTTSATSKLYYVTSPANMKSIVAKASAGGQPAYPGLGPNGGEIFPGVTAIASDVISSSAALMFDATALLGNADAIVPDSSEIATLNLESAPDSPVVAGTTLLSLWQADLRALRLERWFGFTVLRSSGIASLSGVAY